MLLTKLDYTQTHRETHGQTNETKYIIISHPTLATDDYC